MGGKVRSNKKVRKKKSMISQEWGGWADGNFDGNGGFWDGPGPGAASGGGGKGLAGREGSKAKMLGIPGFERGRKGPLGKKIPPSMRAGANSAGGGGGGGDTANVGGLRGPDFSKQKKTPAAWLFTGRRGAGGPKKQTGIGANSAGGNFCPGVGVKKTKSSPCFGGGMD